MEGNIWKTLVSKRLLVARYDGVNVIRLVMQDVGHDVVVGHPFLCARFINEYAQISHRRDPSQGKLHIKKLPGDSPRRLIAAYLPPSIYYPKLQILRRVYF